MPLKCLASALEYLCGMQVVSLEERVEENEDKLKSHEVDLEDLKLTIAHLKKGIPKPAASKNVNKQPNSDWQSGAWTTSPKKASTAPTMAGTEEDYDEDEFVIPKAVIRRDNQW